MSQLKHITNNSILGRYVHDRINPANPPTCQNIEGKKFKFTTATVLMLKNVNQGYKIDKLSEIFRV